VCVIKMYFVIKHCWPILKYCPSILFRGGTEMAFILFNCAISVAKHKLKLKRGKN
jgi:hypothetical protein